MGRRGLYIGDLTWGAAFVVNTFNCRGDDCTFSLQLREITDDPHQMEELRSILHTQASKWKLT
jgi:hypothetical protein